MKHLFPVPILIFLTASLVLFLSKSGLWGDWRAVKTSEEVNGGIKVLKRRAVHTTAVPYEPPPPGAAIGAGGAEGFQATGASPADGAGVAVIALAGTPEPDRYLGPYRAGGAAVKGTNFDDVVNPLGRKFDETPLDRFYDEYEKAELDAEAAARERAAGDTIDIEEEEGTDMGALFSSRDLDITNIPWDAENRELLPSDVLWGIVSPEASKALFLKAYSQLALSLPDAVQDLRPGDDSSPPAFNMPDIEVSVTDQVTQIRNDTAISVVSAIGQQFNPLDSERVGRAADKLSDIYEGKTNKPKKVTKTNSQIFDSKMGKLNKMQTKMSKISKSNLKRGGPIRKLKHVFKKIMAKIANKMMQKLQKFMTKKLVKAIVMRVISAGILAAKIAASVATFGAASPVLAVWVAVMTALELALSTIDAISMAATVLLPVILEKYLDGEGICPPGAETIQELIPNKVAYFFFTTFVPLGDLVDLFGPYICWDGAEPKLKQRVFEPTYLDDKTLSLSFKKWPEDMEISGDVVMEGNKIQSGGIWECGGGLCKEKCRAGTYTTSDSDTTCHQRTLPAEVGATRIRSCEDMKAVKGATAETGRNMNWQEQAGTGNCFEPYNQGSTTCSIRAANAYNWETGGFSEVVCSGSDARGCGCVRATRTERASCDPGFTLDPSDLRCYKCPEGYSRNGAQCFSATPSYQREFKEMGENFVKNGGYTLPRFLSQISDPAYTQTREFAGTAKVIRPFTSYCNFASPVMLDRMAQFYYEQSYANPDIIEVDFESLGDTPENRKLVDLSGGPMLVQWDYISRFYGVIASSELSCDVACEIRTITYNPITGASFREDIGCSNLGDDENAVTPFDRANFMCYRRFYFIKKTSNPPSPSDDPQGLFTVTGCTNSDGTAPDAEVDSWDEGTTYVPSLPKVFTESITEREVSWSPEDFGRMAVSVGSTVALGKIGTFAGRGSAARGAAVSALTGPALQYGTGELDKRLQKDQEEQEGTYLQKDSNEVFNIMTKKQYVLDNNPAYVMINHGPIVEQATGVAPLVTRCRTALVTDAICAHKYNMRDVIRQYEMDNPKKRVKQIDIIEPRGNRGDANHGCYYRWKEVDYDPETNIENTNFANKEVVFKYRIQNFKTCMYEPERIIYDVRDSDYALRTFTLEGSTGYLTRKKVTKPVRFVRIEGGPDFLQLSQIVVYNTDYVNVARGKVPTSSTSPHYVEGGAPALATYATDGNAMARMMPTIFSSQSPRGVFEIDLGKEEFIHSITIYNRSDPTPATQLLLARRWNGYRLRCLDAARAENYNFALTGEINGQPQLIQTFTDFPTIEMQRRRPFNSFAVPRGLPAETTLGGVETRAVRYIRIDGGADFLQLSQVAVFNINNVNVARGREATANTTAPYLENGMYAEAYYATDGTMEARDMPRIYCSINPGGVFEIDLGREELLNRIVVYNRKGLNTNDRAGLLLLARRWNGYNVRCLDASRTERYEFALQGTTGTGAAEQPNYEQSFLFSPCPTKCSDKSQIERLVKEFNDANANARIVKVLKAWTPKPNRCDFEVEMMRIGAGGQRTFSKETTFMNVSRDGNTCSFQRDSDGAASLNSGTYIQESTPELEFNLGGGFGTKGFSIHEAVTEKVRSVFGTIAQTLQQKKPLDTLKEEAVKTEKETRAALAYVAANQTLDESGAKCSDPSIMEVIGTTYNAARGVLKEQFGAERSVMKRILRSVGGGPYECDVLFEEDYELYEDALYPPIEKETRTKAVRVTMAKTQATSGGPAAWSVAAGSIRDVGEEAVGLQTYDQPEVYYVGDYQYTKGQADAICARYGGRVATKAQLEASHRAGADWCKTGWVADDDEALYPITTSIKGGCAGAPGVVRWTPASRSAGVNCFGVRPPQNTQLVAPFNQSRWNEKGEAASMTMRPYVVPSCEVDCRAPANLAAVKAAAGAAASSTNQSVNFRQVTQSFRNGATVCEYKVMKDVTARDPYTKRSSTESDIETYVSATFKPSAAAGASACTYTLDTVQEFPPDEVESQIDRSTGDEIYFLGSKQVQPPMLFSYDPDSAVSQLVNATPVNM